MSEEQKSQFYKLAYKVPADQFDLFGGSHEYKIFASNCFGNSLFLNSSHLNECKSEPNVQFKAQCHHFHESKHGALMLFVEIMAIVAIKDISKGEELKLKLN